MAVAVVPTPSTHDILTRAEVALASYQNAYEAILALRPEFIKHRGGSESVVLDDMVLGDLSQLSLLSAGQIGTARYITQSDAFFKYGPRFSAGAILIYTRPFPPE